jgi:hypothetical protein
MPSGPKNTKYTNRHAEEARARDSQRDMEARVAQQAAREAAEWADDGDRKQQKKLEREREAAIKAQEQAQRRDENQRLLEQEERELSKAQPTKVTKKQMQRDVAKLVANYDKEMAKIRPGGEAKAPELPLQNPNHHASDMAKEVETVKSSGTVAAAVTALSEPKALPDDRHIGKRARVLYRAFCEEHTQKVKEENPGLRRTQLNDVLWEMWQKSNQNPFVQRTENRNAARLAEERRWMEEGSGGDDDDEAEEEK